MAGNLPTSLNGFKYNDFFKGFLTKFKDIFHHKLVTSTAFLNYVLHNLCKRAFK